MFCSRGGRRRRRSKEVCCEGERVSGGGCGGKGRERERRSGSGRGGREEMRHPLRAVNLAVQSGSSFHQHRLMRSSACYHRCRTFPVSLTPDRSMPEAGLRNPSDPFVKRTIMHTSAALGSHSLYFVYLENLYFPDCLSPISSGLQFARPCTCASWLQKRSRRQLSIAFCPRSLNHTDAQCILRSFAQRSSHVPPSLLNHCAESRSAREVFSSLFATRFCYQ